MPAIETRHKREHPREPFSLPVTLTDKNTGEVLDLVISDLSVGGMFVPTPRPLPVGTELKVRIHLEGSEFTVDADGWVVRIVVGDTPGAGSCGMGIHFTVDSQLGWQFLSTLTNPSECGSTRSVCKESL